MALAVSASLGHHDVGRSQESLWDHTAAAQVDPQSYSLRESTSQLRLEPRPFRSLSRQQSDTCPDEYGDYFVSNAYTSFQTSRRVSCPDRNDAPALPWPSVDHRDDYFQKDPPSDTTNVHPKGPFSRWMRSLHRHASHRLSTTHENRRSESDTVDQTSLPPTHFAPQESSVRSSSGFVAAVRSATVSLASISTIARSRSRNTTSSRGLSKNDRGSKAESRATRLSEESAFVEKTTRIDGAAIERSMQRRRILSEIIVTEEGYISDIRFLSNVSNEWGPLFIPCSCAKGWCSV